MEMRFRLPVRVIAFFAALLAAASVAQTPLVTEEQRITSVEIYAGVEWSGLKRWASGRDAPGAKLGTGDLQLFVAGTEVALSSVTPGAAVEQPWQIVLYFDTVLHHQAGLRASALALDSVVAELVELGEVTVVVADPSPRATLRGSRDAAAIGRALGDLAGFGEAGDELPALRREFLAFVEEADPTDAPEVAALGAALVAEERRIGLARRDALASYLMTAGLPGRGRAVFWAVEGFDPDPSRFYGVDVPAADGSSVSAWSRAIAAQGWTAFPFSIESPGPEVREGLRIGKLRITSFAGFLVNAAWEGDRKPELARSYVELGENRLAQGDEEGALEAYRLALRHFYGDPRTAAEQAEVWRRVARLLGVDDDSGRSRWALANAVELDPSLAPELGTAGAYFADVLTGLVVLATETGGALVRNREDLRLAARDLRHRLRLTFELQGAPAGELLAVVLSPRGKELDLLTTRWTRSGIPPEAAAVHLRSALRELADEPAGAATRLSIVAIEGSPEGRIRVAARDGAPSRRVWLGRAALDGALGLTRLEPAPGGWTGVLAAPGAGDTFAIYRDDGESWDVEPVHVGWELE